MTQLYKAPSVGMHPTRTRVKFYWRILTHEGTRLVVQIPTDGTPANWRLNYWSEDGQKMTVEQGEIEQDKIGEIIGQFVPVATTDAVRFGRSQVLTKYRNGRYNHIQTSKVSRNGQSEKAKHYFTEAEAEELRQKFIQKKCLA